MSSSKHQSLITLTGTHLGESAKAIRFRVTQVGNDPLDPPKCEWFPFSQVEKIHTDKNLEGADWIMVSEWICKQKELI